MLARIHSKFASRGVSVVAINIDPSFSLEEWKQFWRRTGAGDVIWAQDVIGATIEKYRLVALGTEVLVDRRGEIVFRRDGPAGYESLLSVVEQLLAGV